MINNDFLIELGIDGETTLARFGGNEALLMKFLGKFPEDPNFSQIQAAVKESDYKKLEIAAHTLKGVSGNLGLTQLFLLCDGIVQKIRSGQTETIDTMYSQIEKEYNRVVKILSTCGA